jgi:hypothetical protein
LLTKLKIKTEYQFRQRKTIMLQLTSDLTGNTDLVSWKALQRGKNDSISETHDASYVDYNPQMQIV